MMSASTLGPNLRAARQRYGKSMSELAKLIGKDGQAVYRWEKDRSRPSFGDLEKLAGLYGMTVGELVDGKPVETEATTEATTEASA